MSHETMLIRSGSTDPDGKKDFRLDVPVTEELYEAVNALAVLEGKKRAEWVRWQLEKIVHGELSMVRRVTGKTRTNQDDSDRMNVG